jgi:hypothetical protein
MDKKFENIHPAVDNPIINVNWLGIKIASDVATIT